MNRIKFSSLLIIALLSIIGLSVLGCEYLFEEDIPTKSKMEGVWEVIEAYDADGTPIIDDIKFPVTAFHLSSDNTVLSTSGPMTMYLVYGGSEYVKIASKIDQVFNYASLDVNGGEFFIEGGQVNRFTLEMKLEGLPGQKALTELLELLKIGNDYLDITVYHKFMDIKVTFAGADADTMMWEFDNLTHAVYNTKNQYGNYILWEGWPAVNFSKCSFVLRKRIKSLEEVIKEHSEK